MSLLFHLMLLPSPLFSGVAEASAGRIVLLVVYQRGTRHLFYLPPPLHPLSHHPTTTTDRAYPFYSLHCILPVLLLSLLFKIVANTRRKDPHRGVLFAWLTTLRILSPDGAAAVASVLKCG